MFQDSDDKTITYDAQGNPTNYLGKTLVWEKGRQLKSINNPINNDTFTYTYNANGIRTSKYVSWDDSKHKYILDGTKLLREEWSAVGSMIGVFVGEIARFLIQNGPTLKSASCKQIILSLISILLKSIIAYFSDKLAGRIISKIRNKTFSPSQTRNYFRNTKYLKSAFGIGKGGKTGARVWFKEAGLTMVFNNFFSSFVKI